MCFLQSVLLHHRLYIDRPGRSSRSRTRILWFPDGNSCGLTGGLSCEECLFQREVLQLRPRLELQGKATPMTTCHSFQTTAYIVPFHSNASRLKTGFGAAWTVVLARPSDPSGEVLGPIAFGPWVHDGADARATRVLPLPGPAMGDWFRESASS